MKILAALLFCSIQFIPLEGMLQAPYLPSLYSPSERAKFLQAAAAQGDAALIGYIHKSDPLAWASGDGWRRVHGTTALHAAAESRDALAVRALIALGADVNALDDQGLTPLHISARSDSALGATIELLDAGAQVDNATVEGVTPLMEAVRYHAYKTVGTLLNAGADRTKAKFGGFSVVTQSLLSSQSGQYTSERDMLYWIMGFSSSPDHRKSYQCTYLESNMRTWFLGSPLYNSTDSLFRTNLHICNRIQAYRHLVSARDLFLRTPLHSAVIRRDKSCVKELLNIGADMEAVDWLNRTPLQIANLCEFSDIVQILNSHAQS